MQETLTITLDNKELLTGVCGANDTNLRIIEQSLGGYITARGNEIHFESHNESGVKRFRNMMDSLITAVKEGDEPSAEFVSALAADIEVRDANIHIPHGTQRVHPRSNNQALYIQAMRDNEICFCIGPAGTGKTYLAIAHALYQILSNKMRKLILTRPVVEAGENLGFLPGDLAQKIDPYLRPLYDAMEALIPFETLRKLEEKRAIEIAPLAYMRGRSLNNCIVILDEAQNTTKEQMKMFLTRIGNGSRAIITGDTTQIDLHKKSDSGLLNALDILRNIEGIHFAFLHTQDVARNPLIKKIINAYNNEADKEADNERKK